MIFSLTMTEKIEKTTEENTNDAQVYELGYHLLPTIAQDELEAEVTKLRSAIENRGGSFISEGTPAMNNLSLIHI